MLIEDETSKLNAGRPLIDDAPEELFRGRSNGLSSRLKQAMALRVLIDGFDTSIEKHEMEDAAVLTSELTVQVIKGSWKDRSIDQTQNAVARRNGVFVYH